MAWGNAVVINQMFTSRQGLSSKMHNRKQGHVSLFQFIMPSLRIRTQQVSHEYEIISHNQVTTVSISISLSLYLSHPFML